MNYLIKLHSGLGVEISAKNTSCHKINLSIAGNSFRCPWTANFVSIRAHWFYCRTLLYISWPRWAYRNCRILSFMWAPSHWPIWCNTKPVSKVILRLTSCIASRLNQLLIVISLRVLPLNGLETSRGSYQLLNLLINSFCPLMHVNVWSMHDSLRFVS